MKFRDYLKIGAVVAGSALAGTYLFNNPDKVIRNYSQFTEAWIQPGDGIRGNRGLIRVVIDENGDGNPDITKSMSFAVTAFSQIRESNAPSQEEIEFFNHKKAEYEQKKL